LREALLSYVQKPSVNVRLVSFRITVLGEVRMPGVYGVPDGKVNVLEAIGYAGDLTIYGKRDNVLVIRNMGDEKQYIRINLNHSDALAGQAYYLQNNDVVYIEPSRGKTSGDDNVYRLLPLVLSGLTFIVVILSLTQ
jgi:polysaccharide export outer membrane protein